jgi:hypothetical protein
MKPPLKRPLSTLVWPVPACNVQQLLGQRRRAALAVGGAQVQVGQLALEKRGSTERMLCASHSMATPCWLLMRSSSARSCA